MTIDELLESYKLFAMSDFEKGERFERLMRNFLLTYPIWRGKISEVWRWKDFPFKNELGSKDLGIDLVVKTLDGNFWAAQCKFYAESTQIHKSAVDSFISNSARTFDGKKFSKRLWITTSDSFTENAREMLKNQSPEVEIINLELLRRLQINWTLLDNGFFGEEAIIVRKLRDYQLEAVNAAQIHYQTNERGQLIMACGTGKTFTSLKIAETLAPDGKILFLVPSISLLRQTLEEWAANSAKPINALCICSDSTAADIDEIIDVNLPLKAMTDDAKIAAELKKFSNDGLTVIFSTYQSIDVVHRLNLNLDLVIADEAHRTTTFSENKTIFTKVHDENFIHADKRLYMTATPKLFKTDAKNLADESKMTDWTMSNENLFGAEFYRISFREAVQRGYLADYKVFVLTVNENYLTTSLRKLINSENSSLKTDDALKFIGALLALSKHMDEKSARLIIDDPNAFMHTAVAFCSSIKDAKRISDNFPVVQEKFFADLPDADKNSFVTVRADYIAGTMTANERAPKLYRLKTASIDGNICNVLSNVRCLSEGVDVPALDAVIFMAAKKSKVEIVQAVGRVMRNAPHKNFGYIIIPVVVPLKKSPEEALRNSKDFNIVWEVVNALRAHDEAMNIELERIRNKLASKNLDDSDNPSKNIIVSGDPQMFLEELLRWDDLKNKIFARMVEHVGSEPYWIQWAHKVAEIVERHTKRINELISVEGEPRRDFYNFVDDLQKNLNPSVTPAEAVDMLAQHLVTRPVFEALFENYSFAKNNPVSIAMQKVLDKLDVENNDSEIFSRLYDRVREMCSNMGDAAQRQRIIIRLYDSFFKFALPKTSEKLGIVYTPVEVVDFILRSVDAVLKKHFNRSISDKNVHVLDPFAGTGTFLVRLIQSGLIQAKDLRRKYLHELHANELVLLAYYIAAINIENAFHAARAENYQSFNGICFTDTFELYERGEIPLNLQGVMKENSARVNLQKNSRIEIIVGNPPYSVGQKSANDNNQNQSYTNLEARIASTYAAKTDATLKRALYDSYIKAFRWASDRISGGGVIGFVTNAGWLDGAAMDGLRKCFAEEFSAIYVFNLRGNARTQGELRRRESGNVFGGGSRAPIAITILVKNPAHVGDAEIFYHDIGDYLTREQKLECVQNTPNVLSDEFQIITPNDKGDWINQRGDDFDTFIPLASDKRFNGSAQSFFVVNLNGLQANRDPWIYNFSRFELEKNIQTTIDYYNTHEPTDIDLNKIIWTRGTIQSKNRNYEIKFDVTKIVNAVYRPFCKQNLYYDCVLIEVIGTMSKIFPTGREENLLICIVNGERNFSALIANKPLDRQFQFNGQCFPLYYYEPLSKQIDLFGENYERRDGISDYILSEARKRFGDVSKEDIFYYVYGFLHLRSYREKFSAELKKSLPRIILTDRFWEFSRAGRDLAEIHLNYETQPFADVEVSGLEKNNFVVKKLRLSKDKTTLYYNEHITIKNIPPRCFEYVVNGRSPLEWIIDRYQIKTDSASGIINNPNDWATEHGDEKYILNLILSSITVSLKTLDIVENLPEIEF